MRGIAGIYLIDPNKLFREGLKRLLESSSHRVVAEAGSIRDALAETDGFPSLIVIDPQPAGPEVLTQLRLLRQQAAEARMVVLTNGLDPKLLTDVLDAGADGYLLKDMSPEALIQSLCLVDLGEKVFPADIAAVLTGSAGGVVSPASRKGLSQREEQILKCLVRGDSNKMVGLRLDITEATVKVHLKSLLRKIGANNRTQAAIWALNNGLGEEARTPKLEAVG